MEIPSHVLKQIIARLNEIDPIDERGLPSTRFEQGFVQGAQLAYGLAEKEFQKKQKQLIAEAIVALKFKLSQL